MFFSLTITYATVTLSSMKINKGMKYRLRPTKKQAIKLGQWIGSCRFIYNQGLQERKDCYEETKKGLSYKDQQNKLPELKNQDEFSWLKEVPSQCLQMALRHLDTAYKNFFKGTAKYPQFKKKFKNTDTITFPQGDRVEIVEINKNNSKVKLPKIGLLKFRNHRALEGKVKSVTISREGSDWYISFCIENEIEVRQKPLELAPIGLDKGIVHTIASSEEVFFDLPVKSIKEIEKEIAKYQRKLAKEEKFSNRWIHFKRIIGNLHRKITRLRKEFLHQLSYALTNNHGLIVVEDLKVRNMSASASGTVEKPGKNVAQKSGLNRSILRQGWGIFQTMLDYKAKWYGSYIEKVNPAYTSQTCSKCRHNDKNNRKEQSVFCCLSCGYTANADINAARNVLRLGLESLGVIPLEAPTITASAV